MTETHPLPDWIRNNLLLPVTCCFMAGASLAGLKPSLSSLYLLTVLFFLAGTLYFLLKKPAIPLILTFMFLVGFIHTDKALQPPEDPSHIYNLVPERSRLTLEGTVVSMITFQDDKSRFELQVHGILRRDPPGENRGIQATGKIRVSVRGRTDQSLHPGQRVLIVATVDTIHNYQTPGTFNYVRYMHNQGIYNSAWVRSPEHIQPVSAESHTGSAGFTLSPEKIRQHIALFLHDHCSPTVSGLYQALLIGERSGIPPDTREQFIKTGCMHLLSISGLHMGLLALMLYFILSWILKRSRWLLLNTHIPTLAVGLSFPLLLYYAFIAGMNTPVFRSIAMAAVVLTALLVRRQTSILHLVAAAALIVLTINPLSLFTASFQLSFAAMVAIALLYPRLSDALLTQKSLLPHEQKSILTPLLTWPLAAFLISLAATIGTLPFVLYHFNRFSPLGPVMNLAIEPLLCFIALPLGLVAAPMISLAPDWAPLVFNLGGMALNVADNLTRWAAQFPYASLWTITPSPIEIGLYYFLIVLACTLQQRWKYIVLPALFTLLLVNFTTDLREWFQGNVQYAQITFLDVGQGTATLLEFTDGTKMLLDGGGSFSRRYDVGKSIIAPFLWKKRIRHLDTVIITHPDSDHYSGLPFIIAQFHPETVYTNGQQVPPGRYRDLMERIAAGHNSQKLAPAGTVLHQDKLCTLSSLGMQGLPTAAPQASDNNQSIVLKLQCGSTAFLFPGDIEQSAEELLIREASGNTGANTISANILLASHHGSKTSNSHAFIQAVAPELIIASAGRTKTDFFPAREHISWWKEHNIPYLVTGVDGTIFCVTNARKHTPVCRGLKK